MINWEVRIRNKNFWLSLIPAILLLIQVVANVFGYQLDLGDLGNKLLAVVNAVFAVLAILGIVTDPTTAGISDSNLAMTYDYPKPKDGFSHTHFLFRFSNISYLPSMTITTSAGMGVSISGGILIVSSWLRTAITLTP